MRGRNPALVVDLGARDGGAISANNGNLLGRVDLLGATGGLLRALATLASATLLGEEGGDPGAVDEVDGSGEDSEENKVEEDAVHVLTFTGYVAKAGIAYICGSRKLVGASTMLTVSL